MPLHTAEYHYLSCSAKQNNLLFPICQTQSEAGFGKEEDIITEALENGWTRNSSGRDFLCPMHAKLAVPEADKPARKPRTRGFATPGPDDGSQGPF